METLLTACSKDQKLRSNAKVKQTIEDLAWARYVLDWNLFAFEYLKVNLDDEQKECLKVIQENRQISIASGHARGKDFMAAVAAICFLYLCAPSIVICTAPSDRQVHSINMAEISSIHAAAMPLHGRVLDKRIAFQDKKHFLTAFKAPDKDVEAWTGFHSPNILVIFTEASGIEDSVFNATEGLMTSDNAKKLLIFNQTQLSGEAYRSTKSPRYKHIRLNCLNSPNVLAKKTIIPGQVSYDWVQDKVLQWTKEIDPKEFDETLYDFIWEGQTRRVTNDWFRVKVLGLPPTESESQLIKISWIEASNNRWLELQDAGFKKFDDSISLRLGCDVAGMGRDKTVMLWRYDNYVTKIMEYATSDHMEIAGRVVAALKNPDGLAFMDSIGEGAGSYARVKERYDERGLPSQVVSVKYSENAKGLTDASLQRTFANMRAYCLWCIRDALDPQLGGMLALPPDEELAEELTEINIKGMRSNGDLLMEPKDDIKARIGRSPDKSDALGLTYYPQTLGMYQTILSER